MRRSARTFQLLAVTMFSPWLVACLWDRDTLAEEAKERSSELEVLVGWFDRYPAEYYSMRLERVREELMANPGKLDLYDDAAVALDRLHRSDEAVEMMARKKAALDALPDSGKKQTHQYRYLANLGTFHAHRWVRRRHEQGKENDRDLELAEKYISEAIELNPEAHFGREKYQLYTIQWLQPARSRARLEGSVWSTLLVMMPDDVVDPAEAKEMAQGLSGMVRLGAAWQSMDIYAALAQAYAMSEDGSLSLLAQLRVKELIDAGQESLHYDQEIRKAVAQGGIMMLEEPGPVEQWYARARKLADTRHALRLHYMRERFARGEHPDTHADFWNDWREMQLPEMPDDGKALREKRDKFIKTGMIAVCGLLGLLIFLRWWIKKAQKRSAPGEFNLG